jgi:hypothetical protein
MPSLLITKDNSSQQYNPLESEDSTIQSFGDQRLVGFDPAKQILSYHKGSVRLINTPNPLDSRLIKVDPREEFSSALVFIEENFKDMDKEEKEHVVGFFCTLSKIDHTLSDITSFYHCVNSIFISCGSHYNVAKKLLSHDNIKRQLPAESTQKLFDVARISADLDMMNLILNDEFLKKQLQPHFTTSFDQSFNLAIAFAGNQKYVNYVNIVKRLMQEDVRPFILIENAHQNIEKALRNKKFDLLRLLVENHLFSIDVINNEILRLIYENSLFASSILKDCIDDSSLKSLFTKNFTNKLFIAAFTNDYLVIAKAILEDDTLKSYLSKVTINESFTKAIITRKYCSFANNTVIFFLQTPSLVSLLTRDSINAAFTAAYHDCQANLLDKMLAYSHVTNNLNLDKLLETLQLARRNNPRIIEQWNLIALILKNNTITQKLLNNNPNDHARHTVYDVFANACAHANFTSIKEILTNDHLKQILKDHFAKDILQDFKYYLDNVTENQLSVLSYLILLDDDFTQLRTNQNLVRIIAVACSKSGYSFTSSLLYQLEQCNALTHDFTNELFITACEELSRLESLLGFIVENKALLLKNLSEDTINRGFIIAVEKQNALYPLFYDTTTTPTVQTFMKNNEFRSVLTRDSKNYASNKRMCSRITISHYEDIVKQLNRDNHNENLLDTLVSANSAFCKIMGNDGLRQMITPNSVNCLFNHLYNNYLNIGSPKDEMFILLSMQDLISNLSNSNKLRAFLYAFNNDQSLCAELYNEMFQSIEEEVIHKLMTQSPDVFAKNSLFMRLLSPAAKEKIQGCYTDNLRLFHTLSVEKDNIARNGKTVQLEMFSLPRITFEFEGETTECTPSTEDKVPFLNAYIIALQEAIAQCNIRYVDDIDIEKIEFENKTYTVPNAQERKVFLKQLRAFLPLIIPPVFDKDDNEINFTLEKNRLLLFSPLLTMLHEVTLSSEQKRDYLNLQYAFERAVIQDQAIKHTHFSLSPKTPDSEEWQETDRMIGHISQKLQELKQDASEKFVDTFITVAKTIASSREYCFGRYGDEIKQAYGYLTESSLPDVPEETKSFEIAILNDLESLRSSLFLQYLNELSQKHTGYHTHFLSLGQWVLGNKGFPLGVDKSPEDDLAASTIFRAFGKNSVAAYRQWNESKSKEGLESLRQAAQSDLLETMYKTYTPLAITTRAQEFIDQQLKYSIFQVNIGTKDLSDKEKADLQEKIDRAKTFLKNMGLWLNKYPESGVDSESMLTEDYNYVEHFKLTDVVKILETLKVLKSK